MYAYKQNILLPQMQEILVQYIDNQYVTTILETNLYIISKTKLWRTNSTYGINSEIQRAGNIYIKVYMTYATYMLDMSL